MIKNIEVFGVEYKSLKEVADAFHIDVKTIYSRVSRGYTIEEAVTLTTEKAQKNSYANLFYNRIPLEEEKVRQKFQEYGYKIIEYTYQNNTTRMLCQDEEGYRVYMNYISLDRNRPFRFSVTSNADNFVYNANLYAKQNNYHCVVEAWKMGKNQQPNILCTCECGRQYWRNFNLWKGNHSDVCTHCRHIHSHYEDIIEQELISLKLNFSKQYRFDDCRNQRCLPFDFYLVDYNCCIEVDGEQHFNESSMKRIMGKGWKEGEFEYRLYLDKIKTIYCIDHDIDLIRIPYTAIKNKEYKQILLEYLTHN